MQSFQELETGGLARRVDARSDRQKAVDVHHFFLSCCDLS